MRVVWSKAAREDLAAIRRYIASDSPRAANRWVERLVERGDQLSRFPGSGRPLVGAQEEGLRELIEGNYRIVYRLHSRRIEILTVFEGQRQFPPLDPGGEADR